MQRINTLSSYTALAICRESSNAHDFLSTLKWSINFDRYGHARNSVIFISEEINRVWLFEIDSFELLSVSSCSGSRR